MDADDDIKMSRYRDDPLWDDVVPIPLRDDERGPVRLITIDAFNDAFMYLRAVLQTNEMSERCFELTTKCINFNPANYTVWQYRRNLLKALNKDLDNEFEFISEQVEDNPKNYQVWQHRRVLVQWTSDYSRELEFIAYMIQQDSKNYHAWQYRQWILSHFNLFSDAELEYTTELIIEDIRNNSSWNHRYFVMQGLDKLSNEDALNEEIKFTFKFIEKAPKNESSWNYLSGILFIAGISSRPDVLEFCKELCKKTKSPYCLSFMVDVLLEKLENKVDVEESSGHALELLKELKNIDSIRTKYWEYCERSIGNLLQLAGSSE